MTTLPRFGANIAPKDTGGTYAVVHLCTGLKHTAGWDYRDAVEIAKGDNHFQVEDAQEGREAMCANGLLCLGWVAWKEPVTGGFEP